MVRSPTKAGPARTDQDLLVAIEAIYAAALSPDLWPAALSRIADLCGAKWTILSAIPINPISPGTTVQNEEGDPAQLALFSRRFTTPENNPAIPVLLTSPVGRITLQEEHFTPKQWERTKIYNEVYRPAGVHASLGVPLLRSEGYLVPLGVMRDRARGSYDRWDLAALALLIPHLQSAARTMLRLNVLDALTGALEQSWNRLAYGVILLGPKGRILWSNQAGERVLSRNDGLGARAGALYASIKGINGKLQALVGQATSAGTSLSLADGGVLSVPRCPPARPLSLTVSPLREAPSGTLGLSEAHRPVAVVFVSDPDAEDTPSSVLLRRLFDLTGREAALAGLLVRGLDLREASEEMGVSLTTVRTHLGQVFVKTNTHRQSELIRLLLKSVVVLDRGRS
jgi:DNA-binding CsgD family transcriptional regulator